MMGSGPRAGLGELLLPELQKGSSIMPGKVNPVIPEVVMQVCAQVIGNDTAITIAGLEGNFELNVRVPLIARNLLDSIRLLTSAARVLAEKCIDDVEANEEGCRRSAASTRRPTTASWTCARWRRAICSATSSLHEPAHRPRARAHERLVLDLVAAGRSFVNHAPTFAPPRDPDVLPLTLFTNPYRSIKK